MGFNPIEVVDKFAPEEIDKGPIAFARRVGFRRRY
jgi:hypothetical protein